MVLKFRNTFYREARTDSPVETFMQDRGSATRQIYFTDDTGKGVDDIGWSSRIQAREDFLGKSFVTNEYAGVVWPNDFISRKIPHQHPDYPGQLYADGIGPMRGVVPERKTPSPVDPDGLGDVGTFDEALATVSYSAPMYAILSDTDLVAAQVNGNVIGVGGVVNGFPDESTLLRYIYPRIIMSAKYQTIPAASGLRYAIDAYPLVVKQTILLHDGDIFLTWFQVPLDAWNEAAMREAIGKTNMYAFGSPQSLLGMTCAPGTLVAALPDIQIIRRPTGEFARNITLKFKYYPFGANKFYRWEPPKPDAPVFPGDPEKIDGKYPPGYYTAGVGPKGGPYQPLYREYDYGLIFQPPA